MRTWLLTVLAVLLPGAVVAGPPVTGAHAAAGDGPNAVAIGIPGEDLGDDEDAGAVEVRYRDGRSALVTAPDQAEGDRFGTAVELVELTGDDRPDLLVGAPGQDVDYDLDVGAVYFFRGTAAGFELVRLVLPGSPGVPVRPQQGAGFGSSLDARPGAATVGMPGWDAGAAADAGAVVTLTLSSSPTPVVLGRLLTQGDGTVPGRAESGDRFGAVVSGVESAGELLAIGAPGETVDGQRGAGAVTLATPGGNGTHWSEITQDSPGMPGLAEAGDGFGAAIAFGAALVWIGVPGEDLDGMADAGLVNSLEIDAASGAVQPWLMLTQDSLDPWGRRAIQGTVEAGDRFGTALAAYLPGEQVDEYALLIGVPGEDLGAVRDAGMVNGIMQGFDGLTQNSTAGDAEPGDRFGASVRAAVSDDPNLTWRFLIGAPGEDRAAGSVVVDNAEIWKQRRGYVEPGDGYGGSFGWMP